ncbi:alkaline phosphatase family protein [Mesorhizobium sp. SP-1A]|uniref:alkaline phosphatase family protein n=1 Tax=Mesorhizobium sp. SP-1A TaxID=3077840 RepID=UPI0028F72E25|nr:alkaline phosphatase family protein [Mesorhizobium sp. SP-1A]
MRPNVLFICADQWRGDCLSALGHPNVRTPNLDALAADGVLFSNHFGQCTPCGPSRTSLLTGLYLMNHRSGRNGTPLDARHTNIALEARKAGYEPALFGYTDTSMDPRGRDPNDPVLTGYDKGVMPGFVTPLHLPDDMEAWIADLAAKGYDVPAGRDDAFRPRPGFDKPADRGFRYIPTVFPAEHSETAYLADRFLEWLSVRQGKPWFAHVVFYRPHPPLIAPEPYNALLDPADVEFPVRAASVEEECRQHPLLAYELERISEPGRYDEHSPIDPVSADELEIRQMRAAYYGLIAEVDHHVGRIVAHLKRTGEYERTLIVVTSDHAEMLGEHHVWGKEIYFDPAFHLPLVIWDPRREADAARGGRIDAFTEAVDIMPTILDWLGMQAPRTCDGRSLLPLVEGTVPDGWREAVFFEHDFRNVATQRAETALGITSDQCSYAAIRDRRYKYVHFAALPPLLFDMAADPSEMKNLAPRPEMAATVAAYAQKMLSWRLEHADRALTNMQLTKDGVISRP